MSSGWVKNWRKLDDNPYLQEYDVAGVFQKMIRMAQREEREVSCGIVGRSNKILRLKRGQLWLSTRSWATGNTTHKRIRTIIKILKDGGLIDTQPGTQITIVTICNYDTYQSEDGEVGTQTGTQGARKGHAKGTVNQEEGEREKEEKESSPTNGVGQGSFDIGVGNVLPLPDPFDGFWECWDIPGTKRAKDLAKKSYVKAIKDRRGTHQEICAGVRAYMAECRAKGTDKQYIAHPATFLNDGRWKDEFYSDTDPYGTRHDQSAHHHNGSSGPKSRLSGQEQLEIIDDLAWSIIGR